MTGQYARKGCIVPETQHFEKIRYQVHIYWYFSTRNDAEGEYMEGCEDKRLGNTSAKVKGQR